MTDSGAGAGGQVEALTPDWTSDSKSQTQIDRDRRTDMLLWRCCIGGGGSGGGGGGGPVSTAMGHLYTDLTQPLAKGGGAASLLAAPGPYLPTCLYKNIGKCL